MVLLDQDKSEPTLTAGISLRVAIHRSSGLLLLSPNSNPLIYLSDRAPCLSHTSLNNPACSLSSQSPLLFLKMHCVSYVSLFFTFSSLTFAQTPADGVESTSTPGPEEVDTLSAPTPTPHGDDLARPQNGAIVPTASGEIGINPVDLPPVSYVLLHVLKTVDFVLTHW